MTKQVQSKPKIYTLTMNPSIDKNSTVDTVLAEHKLRCGPPSFEAGGGGINVSRAVGKLGGCSKALYPAGGFTGNLLAGLLDRESLDHSRIPVAGMTRENLTVFESSSGSQYRFGMPGAEMSANEWRQCLVRLEEIGRDPPDYFVMSGSLPPGIPEDFYARALACFEDTDCRCVVDSSGPALAAAAMTGVFLLKPNLRELGQIAGRNLEDEADQEAVAWKLIEAGKSETVLVSLGSAGTMLVMRNPAGTKHVENIRAPRVPIRSKIGAGDSMVAGTILALARGRSLREAVLYGMAAGSSAVMTPGTELCRADTTERLFKQLCERCEALR